MNTVKRFNSEFRGMIERPDGQFVFASEYDKVHDQLCASQADAVELARKYYNRTPTEWAYGQVCSALEKHRARADAAEAKLAELEELLSGCNIARKRLTESLNEVKLYRPAPAADLAKLVPDEMSEFPGKEIIDRYFNWTDKDDAEVFAVGFNACRAAILREIEECGSFSSGADWFREQYLLKITPPQKQE